MCAPQSPFEEFIEEKYPDGLDVVLEPKTNPQQNQQAQYLSLIRDILYPDDATAQVTSYPGQERSLLFWINSIGELQAETVSKEGIRKELDQTIQTTAAYLRDRPEIVEEIVLHQHGGAEMHTSEISFVGEVKVTYAANESTSQVKIQLPAMPTNTPLVQPSVILNICYEVQTRDARPILVPLSVEVMRLGGPTTKSIINYACILAGVEDCLILGHPSSMRDPLNTLRSYLLFVNRQLMDMHGEHHEDNNETPNIRAALNLIKSINPNGPSCATNFSNDISQTLSPSFKYKNGKDFYTFSEYPDIERQTLLSHFEQIGNLQVFRSGKMNYVGHLTNLLEAVHNLDPKPATIRRMLETPDDQKLAARLWIGQGSFDGLRFDRLTIRFAHGTAKGYAAINLMVSENGEPFFLELIQYTKEKVGFYLQAGANTTNILTLRQQAGQVYPYQINHIIDTFAHTLKTLRLESQAD